MRRLSLWPVVVRRRGGRDGGGGGGLRRSSQSAGSLEHLEHCWGRARGERNGQVGCLVTAFDLNVTFTLEL